MPKDRIRQWQKPENFDTRAFEFSSQQPERQGQVLAPEIRSQLEPGFGHSFADVRVFSDSESNRQARGLEARDSIQMDMNSHAAFGGPVQRKAFKDAELGVGQKPQVIAESGVENANSPLPHLETIQRSFGHHDLGSVRAEIGGEASNATNALGAEAYTTGNRVAFSRDPDLQLAAHEASHVVQQRSGNVALESGIDQPGDKYEQHAGQVATAVVRGESAVSLLDQMAGSGATPVQPVIQRQVPNSSPLDTSVGTDDAGYSQESHAPSFHVRIVSHASPRWQGASDNKQADQLNLALSQQRADAVRVEVEKLLADHFVSGATVTIDHVFDEQDGIVGIESEAHGSQDTLQEARGNRSDNDQQRRRVDVIIDSSQRITGFGGASRPLLTRPTASKFWHISVDMSAGGSLGAAASLLTLSLTNDSTGETMQGKVWAAGGGPKAALGASASIWSDSTGFSTDEEINFSDFEGNWINYSSAGLSLFLGYSESFISFTGLGSGAHLIDVSGWSAGTAGVGAATVAGKLSLDGSYPPESVPIKDSDTTVVPYERTDRGEDKHKVLFATGNAKLKDLELEMLDSFVASVVASRQ
jgi:hypothetical protein